MIPTFLLYALCANASSDEASVTVKFGMGTLPFEGYGRNTISEVCEQVHDMMKKHDYMRDYLGDGEVELKFNNQRVPLDAKIKDYEGKELEATRIPMRIRGDPWPYMIPYEPDVICAVEHKFRKTFTPPDSQSIRRLQQDLKEDEIELREKYNMIIAVLEKAEHTFCSHQDCGVGNYKVVGGVAAGCLGGAFVGAFMLPGGGVACIPIAVIGGGLGSRVNNGFNRKRDRVIDTYREKWIEEQKARN